MELIKSKKKEINANEIDKKGSLCVAVCNENVKIVECLLKVGCNPSINNSRIYALLQSPLYLAIEKGNLKILKLLLEHDANVNLRYILETPLHYAIWRQGDVQIIKELLDHGADSNGKNDNKVTPMLRALQHNRIDIAKILLEYDADVNISCFSEGHTALHQMALRGDLEAVEFLLQNGAHVDKVGNENVTPLFGCLKMPKDLIYIAETLLKHGADINYPCGESEQTVLHHAVYRGKLKIVEFLLKHEADVNALDCDEMTPLYWATFYNKVKIVRSLLINCANPNI